MMLKFFTIFLFCSVIGWVIEVIYVLIKSRKLDNRGFLTGPYLPLYGFGGLFFYLIASIDLPPVLKLLAFPFLATSAELLTGLVFLHYYNIRLWDYSHEFLNFKGCISLKYSFFWFLLGVLFYFILYPLIEEYILLVFSTRVYLFFVGFFCGLFTVDVFNSFGVAYKLKKLVDVFNKDAVQKIRLNYDKFKENAFQFLRKHTHFNLLEKNIISLHNFVNSEFRDMVDAHLEKIREERQRLKKGVRHWWNRFFR